MNSRLKITVLAMAGLVVITSVIFLAAKPDFFVQRNIDGIWQGSFDINGRGDFDFTALYVSGKVVAVSNGANVVYQGKVSNTGKQFLSEMDMYIKNKDLFGKVDLTGDMPETDMIDSTFLTREVNDTGKLKLIRQPQQYERAVSLGNVAGEWILYHGFTIIKFTIENDGSLRGADTIGCAYEGNIAVIKPDSNAYELDVLISSCPSDGRFSGMAYLSSSIDDDDTLNLHLFNEAIGFFFPIVRNDDTRLIDKNRDWGKNPNPPF